MRGSKPASPNTSNKSVLYISVDADKFNKIVI